MYDKIVVLRKTKLDTTEVLISKALIDCYISHDEFLLINNVFRKYNKMKEEIKNAETSVEYIILKMETYCKKILRNKNQVLKRINKID